MDVTGAMGSLIGKLGDLLKEEYKLQKGVQEQVEFLKKELESAHAALTMAAEKPLDKLHPQHRIWAREVGEASYDMEDILDTFLVHVEDADPADKQDNSSLKRLGGKMAKFFKKTKARHTIAGAIEDIKKRLQQVTDRRARYTFTNTATAGGEVVNPALTRSTIDPRLHAMYNEMTRLIGISKSSGDLISKVSPPGDDGPNKNLKSVSVVGVGGLGKTTLAKAVYDKLKVDFDCWAFVPVGQNPDMTKVLRDILIDVYESKNYSRDFDLAILDGRQITDKIRQFLNDKRYLIVIDDIWEVNQWKTIKPSLVQNSCGSRVITTTRKFEVATEASDVYELQPLSCDDSKSLLYARIFDGEVKCPDNQLDELSDTIIKKCAGIPLAIITMASLLVRKPRGEWSELYNSVGFGHGDNQDVDNTMRILSFSYYDLPSHLKPCLLYMSVYPEDFLIDKDSLIWKWIAEGFVHENQGRWSFELGEGYFNDLINRSLIQAVFDERNGMVYYCRIHDMVLDLIRKLSCEKNFVTILENDEGTFSGGTVRRLAHQNITVRTPPASRMDMPQARSFIGIRCNYVVAYKCDSSKWFPLTSFKLLRVLAIEDCKFSGEGRQISSSGEIDVVHFSKDCHLDHIIGNLLHLRYLGLRNTSSEQLPKEIGALKFLRILDLKNTNIRELPPSLGLLTELVCLHTNHCCRVPDYMGKLTSLEELRMSFGGQEECIRLLFKELRNLRELRVLQISFISPKTDESVERDLVESLGNLHKIQHLRLLFDHISMDAAMWEAGGFALPQHLRTLDIPFIRFSRLPSWINPSSLPSISRMSLDVDAMDEKDMRMLGGFPELHSLKLKTRSTVTVKNTSDGRFFQKLRFCDMHDSMVKFVASNEEGSSSISFHMWNGEDAMPLGFEKKKDAVVAPTTVMPNLKELRFGVHVQALKDCDDAVYDSLCLEYLPSLRVVCAYLDDRFGGEEKAMAALRHATDSHPNRPTLKIYPH